MDLSTLEWHDGTFDEMRIKGDGEVMVACHVYPTENAKTREKLLVRCEGVTALTGTMDFSAVVANRVAGNINNGRLEAPRKGVSVLKLFLTDGYIELTAKKITTEQ